jgi:poly-gamma-glutamate capsule biosynthesis protein CapA/YwtB (metallophosphatase superfamily)
MDQSDNSDLVTLFLAGDVMTGRGIDQILPHPGDDELHEDHIKSALEYVRIAERANGPLRKPVAFDYIWGDALSQLDRRKPDARIINLETAVTYSVSYEAKGINYKMSPANVPAITAASIDCCILANNHVLDWGRPGLIETLSALERAGVHCAGAGPTRAAAETPVILDTHRGTRVLVFGFASPCCGTPRNWAATNSISGVNLLPNLSLEQTKHVSDAIHAVRKPRDVVIASIHWGGNWGYEIPGPQALFAHHLIDAGAVDLVHGHSSHHFKGIEAYHSKCILYGCGDFINDYEGIGGRKEFRDDLALMYFPSLSVDDGRLVGLELVPLQIRNMRLNEVSAADQDWLLDRLNRECASFGTRVGIGSDHAIKLQWT